MMFTAQIKVMPLTNLLDPQGKAVLGGLENLTIHAVKDVRIGKHITLTIEADTADAARAIAETATNKLLANPVMEQYEISIQE
jgi:phosphoribosylformylglycinamidine synthase